MELSLHRIDKERDCCMGKLYEGNNFVCDVLEDKDRGLKKDWELATIKAIKVPGETAIPIGRYEIEITFSNRFQRPLPQLMNVPGFEGIRIHSGNTAIDTHGCLLCGVRVGDEMRVLQSRKTFEKVYKLIGEALLNERVYITVQ